MAVAPVHSLPWYFGVVVFSVWAAATVSIALLVRRRLRARADERARKRQRRRRPPALGTGNPSR